MKAIAPMRATDWPAVARIYAEGIATGHATFAESPPATWAAFCAGKLAACSLVARSSDGTVGGWAALSVTSPRAVYRGVAEVSIYIAAMQRGRGAGRALLDALVATSEAHGIWTLTAGIFPENEASVRLHQACGFNVVGVRQRLGLMTHGPMAGRWRDVLWLERRSDVVGVDEATG